MPIVAVTALPPDDQRRIDDTLTAVASDLATALGDPVQNVWVHFSPMLAVVQGESRQGFVGHCPVVVIRGRPRDPSVVARGLRAVAAAVAAGLGVPLEDVWVQWIDVLPGAVFAGGELG